MHSMRTGADRLCPSFVPHTSNEGRGWDFEGLGRSSKNLIPSLPQLCWYFVLRMNDLFRQAKRTFQTHGTLRMSDALNAGVTKQTLYAMRDAGVLIQISRGVYRLASLPPLGNPDLVTVAIRVPSSVVCLISALAFHELTTQIPHAVDIAIARGAEKPRIQYPPINLYWFSEAAFKSGIVTPIIDGKVIRIYSAEKCIADAFKYRNKIGLDIALEALKNWRSKRKANIEKLLEQARICRVERVMRPYLEATT